MQDTENPDTSEFSRYWVFLGIVSLMMAGLLSLFIMLGRAPVVNELMFDTEWLHRILVIHVNLALIVSFYAYFSGLYLLIPSGKSSRRVLSTALIASVFGIIVMVGAAFIPAATPVLSNYIPALDHPIFLISLCIFSAGILMSIINQRILPTVALHQERNTILTLSAIPALQAGALLFFVSILIFVMTGISIDTDFPAETFYEGLFWGGGHILQFVNMAAGVGIWMILFREITGEDPVPYRWSLILFIIYTVPVLFSPLLLINGISDSLYITGFTRYMQWGIFPIVTVFMIIITIRLFQAKKSGKLPAVPWRSPYFNGLLLSMIFIIGGFILGAMISGSNTLIPAHYHATLGGITIAFMVVTYRLLAYYGTPLAIKRLQSQTAIQPLIFGAGQALFVSGLAYAGIHGLARKVFGEEQFIFTTEIYVGLALLFTGGSLAIAGGILFLWIIVQAWKESS